jgi:hypothetical protein
MEHFIDLGEAPGIIWLKISGEISSSGAAQALSDTWAAQGEQGLSKVIWDLREAGVPRFSAEQLKGLAEIQEMKRPDLPPARAVFLVKSDLAYGLGRMIIGYFSQAPVQFQVFRDPDQAVEWLREGEGGDP